ncbi:trafficking protein particle complex subunit 4-like [Amphibalanus amphitrite]|uniref:trafficking protein particle complex subunit 4-like n=1 Tax=Amphibalanus amphitrite TaxID=1232801 RepID=UPI001C91853E|nr:trafficking protein particle complex subunit 4-like [Amphibalanus amphitrite]XP_043210768.1 trafficking protein particle complex subunit 4-like [Amphibalanus amphitrite]
MTIYSIYILSKSGGLIFNTDQNMPKIELEKTFSYPIPYKLVYENNRVVVSFGQRDGIKVGHALLAINGIPVTGKQLDDGRDAFTVLEDPEQYPISLKFGWPKLSTNEKIFLASMFYPLFAIASQLSPEPRSSGIQVLETASYQLHCFQTLTGVKFLAVVDPRQTGVEALLRRLHELYADFALKNPFYSLEMPIRCELFDTHVRSALESAEKLGVANV